MPYSTPIAAARWDGRVRCFCILAVAVVAVAGAPAARQALPPETDAAGLRRWAEHGFGPDEAKSWKNVGIDPDEASQWVQSGILFAEWAYQWKGEGFGPADARIWVDSKIDVYTAGTFRLGGFSAAEATTWIVRGVRGALRAKEFRDLGFGPDEAGEWWRLEFFPEDAASWKKNGFSGREALAWKYGEREYFYWGGSRGDSRPLYSVEWAAPWKSKGFSPAEARLAASYDVSFDEAVEWLTAGFGFDEAIAWRDSGFTPADAAKKKAAGLSPVDAESSNSVGSAPPADAIATWHSDIVLRPDATVEVTEAIVVTNVPAGPVERCFSRVFPATVALRRSGLASNEAWPSYDFTSVFQNGAPAAYSVEKDGSGDVTLCIGEKGALVREGLNAYTLRYTTDDRLIAFHDRDRLFFDIVGPVLPMPIRLVSATVHLPRGANTVSADGFAGPRNRKYFVADVKETPEGDVIDYKVTRPLKGDMGFQVAVAVPKGFTQPSLWQTAKRFDRSAGHILSSLVVFATGLGAAFVYFIWSWHRIGRDPKRGAIVPAYKPPGEISPALMRYLVTRQRADGRTIAATLVRLARCGALVIREREGRYRIEKTGKAAEGCAPHEAEFLDRLFADAKDLVVGTADARRRLREASSGLRKSLEAERFRYVAANTRYVWPGLAMSIAGAALALAGVDLSENAAAFAYISCLAVAVAILNLTFWSLLKAPTVRGQRLFEDLEGFRRFLEVGYRTPLALHGTNAMNSPPSMAVHLPYAIAFGIDSDRISIADRGADWYAGRSGGFSVSDFSASLGKTMPRAVRS